LFCARHNISVYLVSGYLYYSDTSKETAKMLDTYFGPPKRLPPIRLVIAEEILSQFVKADLFGSKRREFPLGDFPFTKSKQSPRLSNLVGTDTFLKALTP
jgi:hypothetical protein